MGNDMCEVLLKLFHDELEEAKEQEKKDTLLGLLREGLLSISDKSLFVITNI